jgi:hypothetical protein
MRLNLQIGTQSTDCDPVCRLRRSPHWDQHIYVRTQVEKVPFCRMVLPFCRMSLRTTILQNGRPFCRKRHSHSALGVLEHFHHLGTLSVLTNLHKVLLGRRALHGRAWRRTRSPLGPSSAYRYLTLYYNRSPNNSATFRRWCARAHQHEERLRRRRTPPCKHDGARAVEAQRARRVADQRHA